MQCAFLGRWLLSTAIRWVGVTDVAGDLGVEVVMCWQYGLDAMLVCGGFWDRRLLSWRIVCG